MNLCERLTAYLILKIRGARIVRLQVQEDDLFVLALVNDEIVGCKFNNDKFVISKRSATQKLESIKEEVDTVTI